jgi:hypothetical protein
MGKGLALKRHHNKRISEKRYHLMRDYIIGSEIIKTRIGDKHLSDFKGYYKKHHPLSCGCEGCKTKPFGKRPLSIPELKQKEKDNIEY